MVIRLCESIDAEGWLELRQALWPDGARAEHRREMAFMASLPQRFAAFIAYRDGEGAAGLLEVSLREDYVNGTTSSPVGFVEGLYVVPQARRSGVARALVREGEQWARAGGCREMASDAALGNETSHAMHRALGFEETERVVYFRKQLRS
jgi:aminoglycoside 6'-N-acetyltransferase I